MGTGLDDAGAATDDPRRMRRLAPILGLIAALLAGCAGDGGGTRHVRADDAIGPYSGAVLAGELCFVSGKLGERGGTFEHEAATAIDAIEAELARAGLSTGDLLHVTVYLTDMELYGRFNELYAARIPPPYPARVCVAVAALPAGARVELTGVARRR